MGIGVGVKTRGGRHYMAQAPIRHTEYTRRFTTIRGVHIYGKVMKAVVWGIALGMAVIFFILPTFTIFSLTLASILTAKERSSEFNKLTRLPKDSKGKKTIHITF